MTAERPVPNHLQSYRQFVNPYWVDTLAEFVGVQTFVSGKGDELTDSEGEVWLDLVAHYGAAALGHNHPKVSQQMQQYLLSDPVTIQPWGINLLTAQLAERLVQYSPMVDGRVVFMTTGSEAIESAMKMAMSATGRQNCIGFNGGFHGLTLQAMGLMGDSVWSSTLPSDHPTEQLNKQQPQTWLEILSNQSYAAVVLELVLGIGGGICWTAVELAQLQTVCQQTGTLIIVDEVQTGIGRCGEWFCSSLYPALTADMIVVSKGLSAGLTPISAVLVKPEIHHSLYGRPGCARIHGSTFSGNGLAVTTAIAVLDVIEQQDILTHVTTTSQWLMTELMHLQQQYPVIQSIDGKGLLLCIQFDEKDPSIAAYVLQLLMENNILVNLASHRANTLKLTPALNIEKEQLVHFLSVFEAILEHILESVDEVA